MPKPSDLLKLEKDISALNTAWGSFGKRKNLAELIRIIRRPGWTTPAEFMLTRGIIDSLQNQTAVLEKLSDTLLRGARLVGRK